MGIFFDLIGAGEGDWDNPDYEPKGNWDFGRQKNFRNVLIKSFVVGTVLAFLLSWIF